MYRCLNMAFHKPFYKLEFYLSCHNERPTEMFGERMTTKQSAIWTSIFLHFLCKRELLNLKFLREDLTNHEEQYMQTAPPIINCIIIKGYLYVLWPYQKPVFVSILCAANELQHFDEVWHLELISYECSGRFVPRPTFAHRSQLNYTCQLLNKSTLLQTIPLWFNRECCA